MPSYHLPLLAFLVLLQQSFVQASNLRDQQQRQLNQRELAEGTRIFARYHGRRGHRLAKRCARNIIQDNDGDDIIIFQGNGLCMEQLTRDTDILEVDYDNEVYALGGSSALLLDDEAQDEQASPRTLEEIMPWGLEMIQADQMDAGETDITVCIVDTGLNVRHPDLDSDSITGTDNQKFYGPKWLWSADKVGHGTHVAGTIAALSGNGKGVAGAGRFRLHITRALDDDGKGYESDIRNAVKQCVEAGARIINLSLGGPYMGRYSSRYYKEVVEEMGIIIIAAAGNDGNSNMVYPAAHPSVISVGAVYEWGAHLPMSNKNTQVELAAPGHNILSLASSTSSVQVNDFAYPASHIQGSAEGTATGELVYCEANERKCNKAKEGGICVFANDGDSSSSIEDMVESCEDGGGSGAIIFDADGGKDFDNWQVLQSSSCLIPVVAVLKGYGRELVNKMIGDTVTIGDADNDGIEYTYAEKTGTSMASPHVAAAAALLWSHFGDCSNHQIRYAMARTAQNPDDEECNQTYGYGIVKAKDAHTWLSENDCSTGTIWDDIPDSTTTTSKGGCTIL